MKKIKKIPARTAWDSIVGYSRAIRIENRIVVAGTVAADGDKIIGKGDAYTQTRFILEKIEKALIELGANMHQVVRTRMYVKDISQWENIGKAHGEFFKDIRPVTTMIEVKGFIHPDLLLEIEAEAILI